jgi:hypothetical protein
MERKTRSLLEELEALGDKRDLKHVLENRANNVISSAINLIELINKNFDSERAAVLERKLLMAIKHKDNTRFNKSLKRNNDES